MGANLLGLLGHDESDPEVQAALRDANDQADTIEHLVRTRRERSLTQRDVADRMGTTQSAVSNFERIGGNPTIGTIQRYARAVGARVRVSVVIDGSATKDTHTQEASPNADVDVVSPWQSSSARRWSMPSEITPAEPTTAAGSY